MSRKMSEKLYSLVFWEKLKSHSVIKTNTIKRRKEDGEFTARKNNLTMVLKILLQDDDKDFLNMVEVDENGKIILSKTKSSVETKKRKRCKVDKSLDSQIKDVEILSLKSIFEDSSDTPSVSTIERTAKEPTVITGNEDKKSERVEDRVKGDLILSGSDVDSELDVVEDISQKNDRESGKIIGSNQDEETRLLSMYLSPKEDRKEKNQRVREDSLESEPLNDQETPIKCTVDTGYEKVFKRKADESTFATSDEDSESDIVQPVIKTVKTKLIRKDKEKSTRREVDKSALNTSDEDSDPDGVESVSKQVSESKIIKQQRDTDESRKTKQLNKNSIADIYLNPLSKQITKVRTGKRALSNSDNSESDEPKAQLNKGAADKLKESKQMHKMFIADTVRGKLITKHLDTSDSSSEFDEAGAIFEEPPVADKLKEKKQIDKKSVTDNHRKKLFKLLTKQTPDARTMTASDDSTESDDAGATFKKRCITDELMKENQVDKKLVAKSHQKKLSKLATKQTVDARNLTDSDHSSKSDEAVGTFKQESKKIKERCVPFFNSDSALSQVKSILKSFRNKF